MNQHHTEHLYINYDRLRNINNYDFSFATKFNLNDIIKNLKFSSITNINATEKLRLNQEYKLELENNKNSLRFTHNSIGRTVLSTENHIKKSSQFNTDLSTRFDLDEGEFRRNFSGDVGLRLSNGNHYLGLGFVNHDCFKKKIPNEYMLSGGLGFNKEDWNSSINTQLTFNTSKLTRACFYLISENLKISNDRKLRGVLEFTTLKETIANNDLLKFFLRANFLATNYDINMGGNLNLEVNSKKIDSELVVQKVFQDGEIKAVLSSDRHLTFALNKQRGGINIGFFTRSTLGSKSEKSDNLERIKFWVDYNFGFSVEYNNI